MEIKMKNIKIKDLVDKFVDRGEEGVQGYHGKLDIRPPYQREFIYDTTQQQAVIDTVMNGFPLNTMYWAKNADGTLEVMDGQQRTLSICKFYVGDFTIKLGQTKGYRNLTVAEAEKFLNYELSVYICEGTEDEKLAWFKTINIAGEKLTEQELLNAVYKGSWVTAAKKIFSSLNGPAVRKGSSYMTGKANRQEILEKVIRWKARSEVEFNDVKDKDVVQAYMAVHQNDDNANDLWIYFDEVINWIQCIFPFNQKPKSIASVDWGILYNKYHKNTYDPTYTVKRFEELASDEDVTSDKGIYEYILAGETNDKEKLLSLRAFDKKLAQKIYKKQNGRCPICEAKGIDKTYLFEEMQADHIIPWSKGGKTTEDNCQMLCVRHNLAKSDK